jgi:hypothetical protein
VYKFFAVPLWQLEDSTLAATLPAERLDPVSTIEDPELERCLSRAEYRGEGAWQRVVSIGQGGEGGVYARPPNDLPALLRTADQLLLLARQESGERAKVWRCECGTHYALPLSSLKPTYMTCERCGRNVEFDTSRALGEQRLLDPVTSGVNLARKALADFFREAMARGWPVLVERSSAQP